jgi:hypothetical protein
MAHKQTEIHNQHNIAAQKLMTEFKECISS